MTSLSKSFTLEEVEALLAAERERCAKVAESLFGPSHDVSSQYVWAVSKAAAAIRSLAPQTIGGEG